ncbi:unnamed protein product [marine sediment metagenome]|uniref:Peptidase M15A C-terminal domain-containing protein n=1 Tax=marine sediment metagenome TaxID=412755 RepID=X1KCU7_9ZZZZ
MTNKIYFTDEEIQCKCGCGFILKQTAFFWKVNTLRGIVGHPLWVNSWCRCPIHNKAVGGLLTSSHPKGLAVDLDTPSAYIRYRILLAAGELNFRGVGVAETFIHLDNDFDKAPNRFWIY